jgi:hypothetical protein
MVAFLWSPEKIPSTGAWKQYLHFAAYGSAQIVHRNSGRRAIYITLRSLPLV